MKTILALTGLAAAAGAALAGAAFLSKFSVDATAVLRKEGCEPDEPDDFPDDDIPTERERLEAAYEQYRDSVITLPEGTPLADIAAKMGVTEHDLQQACWYYGIKPEQPVAVFDAYRNFSAQFPKYAPKKLKDNEMDIPIEVARKIMLDSGTPIVYFKDSDGTVYECCGLGISVFMDWMQGKHENSPFRKAE